MEIEKVQNVNFSQYVPRKGKLQKSRYTLEPLFLRDAVKPEVALNNCASCPLRRDNTNVRWNSKQHWVSGESDLSQFSKEYPEMDFS